MSAETICVAADASRHIAPGELAARLTAEGLPAEIIARSSSQFLVFTGAHETEAELMIDGRGEALGAMVRFGIVGDSFALRLARGFENLGWNWTPAW